MILFGAVFAACSSLSLLFGTPDSATAAIVDVPCAIDSTYNNVGPEPRYQDSFLPADKFFPKAVKADSGAPNGPWTTFEKFGTRGLMFSRTTQLYGTGLLSDDDKNRSCSIQNLMGNQMAQMVWDFNRFITGSMIGVQQRATDSGPLLAIMQKLSTPVGKMRDGFFVPLMAVMIVLLGLWVIFKNKGSPDGNNTREILSGVVAAMLGGVFVVWLLLPTKQPNSAGPTPVRVGTDPNFYWATASANDLREDLVAGIGNMVSSGGTQADVCQLPDSAANRSQRLVQCRLWEALLFKPWAQAMFGDKGLQPITDWNRTVQTKQMGEPRRDQKWTVTGTNDLRVVLLGAQAFSNDGDFLLRGTPSSAEPPTQNGTPQAGKDAEPFDANKDQFSLYLTTMLNLAPKESGSAKTALGRDVGALGDYSMFRGTQPGARLSTAIGATFAGLLVSVVVLVTSLLSLVWNAVMIVLFVAVALIGVTAMFPPTRKHFMGLIETWGKSALLGGIFGVVQIITAVIVSSVLVLDGVALGWKCILLVVLVVAMFRIIKAAQEDKFTPNMGGETMMDPTNQVNKVREKTTNITSRTSSEVSRRAVGFGAGAVTGAATAAARGRAGAKTAKTAKKAALTNRRAALDTKAKEIQSNFAGEGREKRIDEMAQDRFVRDVPAKKRAGMTDDQRRQTLTKLRGQEAKKYDKLHAKEHADAMQAYKEENDQLTEDATARRGVSDRVTGAASAVRTGAAATAKGAVAGTISSSRYRGGMEGFRAGRVSNTGAKSAADRGRRAAYATARDLRAEEMNAERRGREEGVQKGRVQGRTEQQRLHNQRQDSDYRDFNRDGRARVGTPAEREMILDELKKMRARQPKS